MKNDQSFETWYELAFPRCSRAVHAVVLNRSDAEEATSEAFTRALADFDHLRSHPAPEAWIVTTALNFYRDGFKRRNNPKRWLFAVHESFSHDDQGLSADLLAAMLQLPERQREVIALRVLLDLSSEQSAEMLGISVPTVSTHLRRGLESLRTSLSHNGANHESYR
ncbi:MAG: hypothetical protein RL410_827 [Actinomycetota bacterium]|jgi:RNA polymerase sigma-70 factor (ECF subfamily)